MRGLAVFLAHDLRLIQHELGEAIEIELETCRKNDLELRTLTNQLLKIMFSKSTQKIIFDI